MAEFHHTDVDGDRLAVFSAYVPGAGPGVNLRTDPCGSSVLLRDIPNLITHIEAAAKDAELFFEDMADG